MAAPKHGGKRPGAGRPGGNAQYPARLVARVSERDEEWLAAVAAEEGVAPAEVVRWAIADLRRSWHHGARERLRPNLRGQKAAPSV